MTIETQQGKKSWIGDGSTTNYPYSYPFLNASDIEVYLDGEKQASGFSVQNKTDYSTGANIIFDVAPAEGVLIVVRRNVPMTQEISYPENGEFPAKSHEKSLDKLTMLIIDNNKETLKVGPATPEDFDATFPVPEANKALKITADGKGFTMSDYDPDTALALTENFKNQAQQAAINALSSQAAAANSAQVATQQSQNATTQAANARASADNASASADNAAALNQQLTTNFNIYTDNLINIKEDGMASLSNASNALRNIQTTNCVLETPNRIKIEFDTAGKISLLAGSEVFINNGNGFESYVLETDTPFDAAGLWTTDNSRSLIVVYVPDLHTLVANAWDYVTHSTTPPTRFLGVNGTALWEDTSTGQLKITYDTGATWHVCSLPVLNGRAGGTNIGWIGTIDSIFNGFGFFGQKTFALPGVKKLAPNGRNEDGTLKNIETTTTEVTMYDATSQKSSLVFFAGTQALPYGVKNYFEQNTRPIFEGQHGAWFDTLRNLFFITDDYGATWKPRENWIYLGTAYKADASSNFSNLVPKNPLRVVDYGDLKEVKNMLTMPNYPGCIYCSGLGWFQVTQDSFVMAYGGDSYQEDYWAQVSPDKSTCYEVGRRFDDYDKNTEASSFTFFVPAGWYFRVTADNAGSSGANIFPLKGVY